MSTTHPLVVRPGPPLAGAVRPPGDESVTHRALLLGLLADGTTTVDDANPGEDCLATRRCAAALGAAVTGPPGAPRVRGTAGRLSAPEAPLDCGNSGTTLRLLAGVLAGALLDEIPAWAVAASAARGVSRLRGAGELRANGSDRLRALAEGLGGLGVRVEETSGGLDIVGGPVAGGTVSAGGDRRVAMALALLGTRASGPVRVEDAGCVAASHPGFATDLRSLGAVVEEPAGAEACP